MLPEQLVGRYHDGLLALQDRFGSIVGQMWDRFGGPTDAELEAFLEHVIPLAGGARRAVLDLVAAYFGLLLDDVPSIDTDSVLDSIRNGALLALVYARPVVELRTKLAAATEYTDAFHAARARATDIAATDIVLANRVAAVAVMADQPRVQGYRRVLTGRSCAFCATASTVRYRGDELMPLHPHCDCGIAPIIGTSDPGQIINRPLLANLKAAGGSKYWKGRFTVDEDGTIHHPGSDTAPGAPLEVAVHEHGELGPILTDARHEFTGPDDVAA